MVAQQTHYLFVASSILASATNFNYKKNIMQTFKKRYRDLVGNESYRISREILVRKIANLTGANNLDIKDALWDTNPKVLLEADDEGNRTNQIILPPSKRATRLFEHFNDSTNISQEKRAEEFNRKNRIYEEQAKNIMSFDAQTRKDATVFFKHLKNVRVEIKQLILKYRQDEDVLRKFNEKNTNKISAQTVRNLRQEVVKECEAVK